MSGNVSTFLHIIRPNKNTVSLSQGVDNNVFMIYGNIDLSNGTSLSKLHGLDNSCDWHTMRFLSELINIRDGVFNLKFSDGLTLS